MVHGVRILLLSDITFLSIPNVSLRLKGIFVTGNTLEAAVKTLYISNGLIEVYKQATLYFPEYQHNLIPFHGIESPFVLKQLFQYIYW